jgi:SAM-dependent methyltransferase
MGASRYVDDVPYERTFIPELSPAWLDFAALLWGFAPIDRREGFAWCDLGCGQGVNAVVLAATHPTGQFHGVDAMPEHVDHADRLATAVAADGRARFHAVDFGAALDLDLPQFDYITAHGVYSWVDDRARADLRRFVEARLKPGGRFYVSYNALPGRGADLPFQQLILALSDSFEGDSVERVTASLAVARQLRGVNTPAVKASPMGELVLGRTAQRGKRYLAHEFLNPHWRPLGVREVRRDMASIGLSPAGSASLVDNFDGYVLCAAARRLLAKVDDPDLREMIRDYLINQSFRRDVYVRGEPELNDAAQAAALRRVRFALAAKPGTITYRFETSGGAVGFDNPTARAIVRRLADGPASIDEMRGDPDELAANMLALAASRQIWPVEPGAADVGPFNREVAARWGGPEELRLLALPCGTALQPPKAAMATLMRGTGPSGWNKRLAAYGVHLG